VSGGSRTSPGAAVGSAEALEVFERWYSAHENGDTAALGAVLADDVAVYSLFRAEPVRTRDAAVAHFVQTTTTFSDLALTLISTPAAAADGAVLAEVIFTGAFTGELAWRGQLHRGAAQRFEVPGVVVVGTHHDAVKSVRTLFDRDDWLRQIGIPPD
jgi:steroid delta-isomerase-like uncharacterized protein